MTPRTLRRKLQKKTKRKPYRRCGVCGERRVNLRVRETELDVFRCFKWCSKGHVQELFWLGGGKADTYPAA